MIRKTLIGAALATAMIATGASATPFTRTSPTSAGLVPGGVTEIGGIVLDMIGSNANRIVSQLAASALFSGNVSGAVDLLIGTQTGFTPAIMGQLGGGIAELAIRITLSDGDNGPGDFDDDDNRLLVGGVDIGNWSDVVTQNTSGDGLTLNSQNNAGGFRDNILDTGWFYTTDATALATIFTNISAVQQASFELRKLDDDFQFYDFTQGVDGSLIDVGQGPVITPPNGIPEPATLALFGLGLAGLGLARRRRTA